MQNNAGFDLETLTRSDGTPFVQCVLELIANSLAANAAAIAIRIHVGKREVHVIDNGIGISQSALKRIGEYDDDKKPVVGEKRKYELNKSSGRTLTNIRSSSDGLTIASRYRDSTNTFMKVLERRSASYLTQIEHRPSSGTTVSVYGFHEALLNDNWNMSTLCFFIMAIAVTKVNVSFSIRDEKRKKVVLRIAKPHSSVDVLRVLFGKNLSLNHTWSIRCDSERNYNGYIGVSEKNAKQWLFLNHRPICCPLVLKLIKIAFRERIRKFVARGARDMFVLFFIALAPDEFTCFTENGRRYVMFCDLRRILNNIKSCVFKCLAEKGPARQLHLEPEIIKDDVNDGPKRSVAALRGKKFVIVGVKRKKVTTTVATGRCIDLQREDNSSATEAKVAKNWSPIKTESDKRFNHENNPANAISPLSEWSNWTYVTKNRNSAKNSRDEFFKTDVRSRFFRLPDQFDFLPRKLHGLLQYRHVKLTNVTCFNSSKTMISIDEENWQREQTAVHPCNLKRKLCEFRLSRASLKCAKIVNQVNDEFIAAWTTHGEIKILLMIDQHAAHERIRFEDLLRRYKVQNEDEFLSVSLREPLTVELPANVCDLLLRDKTLLKKYGISLGSSFGNNALLIRAVPRCLVANNDNKKILSKIRGLLSDVLKRRDATNCANILPLTIHNAIASEACHGAIKFGDKLTFEQCACLVELLRYTQSPNRCAHGRPTVIPLMELSELEKRSVRTPEKKLNFASLRRNN
ncbi:DNA mismatch repair protein Mlh3-like isoform X2 [Pseudomyrmex gracilis]|uniref:DNA mismatch repair protein Mlh3-like isoform X2 n=1 Tax=Pseudomyrmex gracilis TaxID=219809 RepID=UPI000994DFCB|nr:DNA mismatch repair protein Mlh3-like isoform X2 [Pseudomyrmex gracilis]